ncbi:MAG: F0F1 ATP synthase subunit B' [Hyphomonadaceae bacterium]
MATPADDTHAVDAPHGADAAHGAAAAHGGEHAAATFPPFDISLFSSQLIWFAITFAVLYVIVSRFIIPSVSTVLEQRAGTLKSDLDTAASKSAEAEAARAAMEKAVAKARADARAMVEAARADMTAKLTAEQEAAETRLTARIEAAEAKVDAARKTALAQVPALADGLARDIAAKLLPA